MSKLTRAIVVVILALIFIGTSMGLLWIFAGGAEGIDSNFFLWTLKWFLLLAPIMWATTRIKEIYSSK